jgi:predicted transcriptional regulator
MIGARTAMSIRIEILRLYELGTGKKKIARILGISPTTVKGFIKEFRKESQTVSLIETVIPVAHWTDNIVWEKIETDLNKPYANIKTIYQELELKDVTYLRFYRALKKNIKIDLSTKARIRYHYKPGERFEMDYCDGFLIHDKLTGKTKKTHLFVCVSSASDYIFGEFMMNQRSAEFINVQDRCFAYYGGVPEAVIIDNLKSGVTKAHKYDPELNPVYCDYAKHMGFIVLPARPRTPRDKPAVEASIGVLQKQFFAKYRDRVFYSLIEMNQVFKGYLEELNSSIMKDYGSTRKDRFEQEKSYLKPLPSNRYELCEYKTAKVHNDCHIQVNNNFYSVPYRFIGKEVRVKINMKMVEVFDCVQYESIAVHAKMNARGEFSTNEAHYPEGKIVNNRLDVLGLKKEAERGGEKLHKLVCHLLESTHPLRFMRRIQGILRLNKTHSQNAMNYACEFAFIYNRFDYNFIQNLARRYEQQGGQVVGGSSVPTRDLTSVFLKSIKTEEEGNQINE